MSETNGPLSSASNGASPQELHSQLQQLGLAVPNLEAVSGQAGPGTRAAIAQLQANFGLPATGVADAATTAVLSGTASALTNNQSTVSGRLVFDYGLPAVGVTIRLYAKGFAGQDAKLTEVVSGPAGVFVLPYTPPPGSNTLEVRVLNFQKTETPISTLGVEGAAGKVLNLVVPGAIQPLAAEFDRLSADLKAHIGAANLGQAQESDGHRDLTVLNRSTGWDARVIALAAIAAQQSAATGLGQDVLYALFRVGMPTDPNRLALVDPELVRAALTKASTSGIVNLNARQIAAAVTSFGGFATKARQMLVPTGSVSTYGDLLGSVFGDSSKQRDAFAQLYFSSFDAGASLWGKAAQLGIPAKTIDALKLQGKFLYLTSNSAPLSAALLKQIGSVDKLPLLVENDLHSAAAWKGLVTSLPGGNTDAGLKKLIPGTYTGTTAERLDAYAADLARKVRMSFPTQVAARMIERQEVVVPGAKPAALATYLKAAAANGYELGQTPLNAFLARSPAGMPALDDASKAGLKQLHRLYQVTPSPEAMQAALKLGFTSALDIASYRRDKFMEKFADAFPSQDEAEMVYGKAQQIASVTFNFFAAIRQVDSTIPVYALSGPTSELQTAKDAIVKQFPTMASLFGSQDFCQCEDCRSVLSPAAYFVDLLEFLRTSAPNSTPPGYTPLDVLVGTAGDKIKGRRPDLGALPLTCENTKTAMPYIDLVNEILEYYIANSKLDANAAYDTGDATSPDLLAEPQHVLAAVYNTNLKGAVYPLGLPFDLWLNTVRGFLGYFNIPLQRVLDALRPADGLELFTDANAYPYYRAQILAESIGIGPADYNVMTAVDPNTQVPSVQKWFQLYGYPDEPTAMNGVLDPLDPTLYTTLPLKSAKNLASRLGLTYQELTDLVTTGFLNPGLAAIEFELGRFQIDLSDAFSYTSQPGYVAMAGQAKTDFETRLDGITQAYKKKDAASTFDAKAWINGLLPANYSKGVLVLRDPDGGCNFEATTLEYADGGNATQLDFLKFNRFVRLWRTLTQLNPSDGGWTLADIDRAIQLFMPAALPAWGSAQFASTFSSAWKTALVYVAHLEELNSLLNPTLGRASLLPLWSTLPVTGVSPLYAQLFLAHGVLNSDVQLDDPAGQFPWRTTDPFALHQTAVQGVLGLSADEIAAIFSDGAAAVTTVNVVVNGVNTAVPSFTLTNLSICYRYALLATCLQVSVADLIDIKAMSGLDPFHTLSGNALSVLADDVLLNQTLAFVKQVASVQGSGFSVEDVKFLLRQQFDPVGKYQADANALIVLLQTMASGLKQISAKNSVPPDLAAQASDRIDQTLSTLLPSSILQALFALVTNGQTYRASQPGVAPANAIDPRPLVEFADLSVDYDSTSQTQSLAYKGVLLDWQKAALLQVNNSPLFAGLLTGLQDQARASFGRSLADLSGVWASLAQYEAVRTGVAMAIVASPLLQKDSALSLGYDSAQQLQRLTYRGVLTDAKESVLTTVDGSAVLAALLSDVQQQAMPAYRTMVGALLATWTSAQTFQASQGAVAPANQIDGSALASNPAVQVNYNAASQTQTLTYNGVLTDAERIRLAGLIPASAVLANLLQGVRNQVVQFFQSQATNILTVAAADLDQFSQPFLAASAAEILKQAKVVLIDAFLPLAGRKLATQFIVQALSTSLASKPALINSLINDAALLADPTRPGKSLLESFSAVADAGVTASYFASADGSGVALSSATAVTADLADPSNPNAGQAGTGSASFEGYLQVLTDGPYRFFAQLGDQNAQVTLRVDSPDPAALISTPLIQYSAASNNDETSQFAVLRGGVAYHFEVDFRQLGANGARLLIQGETLPKSALSQVVLYPQAAITSFIRARTLLANVIQIFGTLGLTEKEASYMAANASQFGNVNLSALPTLASDDSAPKAVALFAALLAVLDYADLRNTVAGAGDRLIDVFEAVGQPFTEPAGTNSSNDNPATPWTRMARLSRRAPQVVRDVAKQLGLIQEQTLAANVQVTAIGDFANHKGIRRIWEALQIVQIIGIPVTSLAASCIVASIAPPAGSISAADAAENLKGAVKARSTLDAWRSIAQSVFDVLRRKKRDALVAYLLQALTLADQDELFEYFLVDPGMEPVVQTSRIRLALSSVQTFIQRCLLNLENGHVGHPELNVAPGAIDPEQWDWMKRYRVWEANRKIFLFAENWMIPELRLDKSDLFQDLEGALLQGDVSRSLVEDAFFAYLKGLEERARLDVVASYIDQDLVHPQSSTVHVIARTYGKPHQYFYRSFSGQTWSAWQVVDPKIEGDHIAVMVWRGRLNLFWLTFSTDVEGPGSASTDTDTKPVGEMSFQTLSGKLYAAESKLHLSVQLHWSELFQGKWSNPVATDFLKTPGIDLDPGFDPNRDIYVHVSKEIDADGNERAAKIHLDLQGYDEFRTFRVTSKNADPDYGEEYWEDTPPMPYQVQGTDATVYVGSGVLQANFLSEIDASGSGTTETEAILDTVGGFELLVAANPLAPPFLDPSVPDYQQAGGLVGPFFYKDTGYPPNTQDELTFFVLPALTEQVVSEWEGWAVGPVETGWNVKDVVDHAQVVAQVPNIRPPIGPGDPYSVYTVTPRLDWATNPRAVISFGGSWIGQSGGLKVQNANGTVATLNTPAVAGTRLSSVVGPASGLRLTLINAGGVRAGQLEPNGGPPLAGAAPVVAGPGQ